MDVRSLQPEKAKSPTLVTLFGIVIEIRLLQPLKAALSMADTLLGIIMDVRLLQNKNILNIDNQ